MPSRENASRTETESHTSALGAPNHVRMQTQPTQSDAEQQADEGEDCQGLAEHNMIVPLGRSKPTAHTGMKAEQRYSVRVHMSEPPYNTFESADKANNSMARKATTGSGSYADSTPRLCRGIPARRGRAPTAPHATRPHTHPSERLMSATPCSVRIFHDLLASEKLQKPG